MRGRKNYGLPDGLDIPGGLTTSEVEEAVKMFRSLREKDDKKEMSIKESWHAAVISVSLSSNDFPEINGIIAMMKHYTSDETEPDYVEA